jgi:hypothetical protein
MLVSGPSRVGRDFSTLTARGSEGRCGKWCPSSSVVFTSYCLIKGPSCVPCDSITWVFAFSCVYSKG